jgi:hypothetical protein
MTPDTNDHPAATIMAPKPDPEPYVVRRLRVGPAPKQEGDTGNPWIHRWIYSDDSVKDVIVGALKPYRPSTK